MSNQGPGGGTGPIPGADEDLGYQIDVIVWILVALSGIILALRLYCKYLKHRGLWWDDNILIVCWVFLVVCAVIGSHNRTLGFGKHVFAVNPANFAALDLNTNVSATFSVLAAVWSKTSFALTMLRLMQNWKMKTFIWFIIVSMNLAMYLTIIFTWLRCTPPAKMTQCIAPVPYTNYSIAAGAYSAAMDFVLAILPWPLIWGLQMKKKEKLGVAIAMSLGFFAGATAIMKCVSLPTMAKGDFTYDGAQLVIWGNAEVATTIMAASIPVLRVLFLHAKSTAGRYYGSGEHRSGRLGGTNGRSNKGHTVLTSSTRGDETTRHKTMTMTGSNTGDDDQSDRSILNATAEVHAHVGGGGKIVRTNEVTLEYSERRGVEKTHGTWFEMDDRKSRYAV